MRRAVSRVASRASLRRKARRDAAIISMRAVSAFTRRINSRFVARRADLHASLSAEKKPCLSARRLPFGAPRPLRLAGSTDETARSTSCGAAKTARNDLFPPGQRGTPCPPGFSCPSRCSRLFCNGPNLLIFCFHRFRYFSSTPPSQRRFRPSSAAGNPPNDSVAQKEHKGNSYFLAPTDFGVVRPWVTCEQERPSWDPVRAAIALAHCGTRIWRD